LVTGLLLLTAQDGNDDTSRFVQAGRGVRKFMLYGAIQACQLVARHFGMHVMFDVVVHVPVEKLHNRVEVNRACAKAEIFYSGTSYWAVCGASVANNWHWNALLFVEAVAMPVKLVPERTFCSEISGPIP